MSARSGPHRAGRRRSARARPSPEMRRASSPARRKISTVRSTSIRDSQTASPVSSVICRASSSRRSCVSCAAASRISARRHGGSAAISSAAAGGRRRAPARRSRRRRLRPGRSRCRRRGRARAPSRPPLTGWPPISSGLAVVVASIVSVISDTPCYQPRIAVSVSRSKNWSLSVVDGHLRLVARPRGRLDREAADEDRPALASRRCAGPRRARGRCRPRPRAPPASRPARASTSTCASTSEPSSSVVTTRPRSVAAPSPRVDRRAPRPAGARAGRRGRPSGRRTPRSAGSRASSAPGARAVASRSRHDELLAVRASSCAWTRFIGGLPMKLATKRLAGCS